MTAAITALAIIVLACSLDLFVGEPPRRMHPVAWFGRLVGGFDRQWSTETHIQRFIGYLVACFLPLLPALLAGGAVALAIAWSPVVGAVLAAVVLFVTSSLKLLLDLTREVITATAADGQSLEDAREQVRGLVGRDVDELSPAQIRSAAIESAGENLADGFAATLLPFALLAPLSLPVAAAVAGWIKGVNTLDSMLGYRSKPHGTGSARLDDVVMFLPARITACSLAVASIRPSALTAARFDAKSLASPNSGWPMAALAHGLDVRLEKVGAYVLNADADVPSVADGERAISVVRLAAAMLVALAAILAGFAPALESLVASRIVQIDSPLTGHVLGVADP